MNDAISTPNADTGEKSAFFRDGWIPYIGTGLSLVICYFKAITVALIPILGISWVINPHLQAVLMWFFGLVAVIAIYRDRNKHGDHRPFYIAATGLLVMVVTLYTIYHVLILFIGYLLILIGTFANQSAILIMLNTQSRQQASELAELNQSLENRVAEQVTELDRIGQLKRFLSPEVADLVIKKGDNALLESHRRYVSALFCDLRGFTSFSEKSEPEEVIDVLQHYHQSLGRLVSEHGGTIDHRAGDGLMVIFNDPLPCEDPVHDAIQLAFESQDAVRELSRNWNKLGYQLGFGVGIAAGYATLGIVGDEQRSDYTAIGNVINIASRLCDKANDGEILVSRRAFLDVEGRVNSEEVAGIDLKGVSRLQEVYRITRPG
jgi:class 3 adenylate cyclase